MPDFINTELDHIGSHENQLNITSSSNYSQDVAHTENKNNSTSNYLVPVLASIGATSIILGCSCAIGYYWHMNGVDINKLPTNILFVVD